MIGRVVSTKMAKTAVVLVERRAKHPLYQKTYLRSKRYLVDDPIGVKEGDIVEITNTKPISGHKHWMVVTVMGRSLEEILNEQISEGAQEAIAEVLPQEEEAATDEQTAVNTEQVKEESKKAKVKNKK
ncbi:30S ribosomal protein S17 [Candidatus Daviesbacteria bacterium]|nr:30S ribosomal protein S17 [Candidatus Daviesbacteria bacterium]